MPVVGGIGWLWRYRRARNESPGDVDTRTTRLFLGDGRRLLVELAKSATLELLESTNYASGNAALRYASHAA